LLAENPINNYDEISSISVSLLTATGGKFSKIAPEISIAAVQRDSRWNSELMATGRVNGIYDRTAAGRRACYQETLIRFAIRPAVLSGTDLGSKPTMACSVKMCTSP